MKFGWVDGTETEYTDYTEKFRISLKSKSLLIFLDQAMEDILRSFYCSFRLDGWKQSTRFAQKKSGFH
jgi:hypothetical protein